MVPSGTSWQLVPTAGRASAGCSISASARSMDGTLRGTKTEHPLRMVYQNRKIRARETERFLRFGPRMAKVNAERIEPVMVESHEIPRCSARTRHAKRDGYIFSGPVLERDSPRGGLAEGS